MTKKNFILTAFVILNLLLVTSCSAKANATPTEPQSNSDSTQSSVTASNNTSVSESNTESDTETPTEPTIMPNFDLVGLDGSSSSLYDYEGKIIVINFWATWCTYCKKEMPLIEALSQNDKYTVLAIDVGEDAETVKAFLDKEGYTFNAYLDESQSLASQFGVTGFPTSVFLGPNFEYLYSYPGMLDDQSLQSILDAIDDYLAKK